MDKCEICLLREACKREHFDWYCIHMREKAEEINKNENNVSTDYVNHPPHYNTGKYESIDVMVETQGVEAVKDFCICNAFKYIYRHKFKNGIEDIKKAIWYLNKYVELDEGK